MSRLGFNRILQRLPKLEHDFLTQGIKLAQKEFKQNFDTESDAQSGSSWAPVKRPVPPSILVETGKLRAQAAGRVLIFYTPGSAKITIDPIDRNGRGYATYHQVGSGVKQRRFVTQSSILTNKHKVLLLTLANKIF